MKLVPEAQAWYKLWSVRLSILSAVLGAIELTLPLFNGVVPPHWFAVASMAVAASAAAARVIRQEGIPRA